MTDPADIHVVLGTNFLCSSCPGLRIAVVEIIPFPGYNEYTFDTDVGDVYKIFVGSGQRLTISMDGIGGDADLYLYPPDTVNINSDPPADYADSSTTSSNTEFVDNTIFAEGFWYVLVYSFQDTTNYNFTVTISSP